MGLSKDPKSIDEWLATPAPKECRQNYRQCIGKGCYTATSVLIAADRYSRKRGVPLRGYWCKLCGSWHLTKRA